MCIDGLKQIWYRILNLISFVGPKTSCALLDHCLFPLLKPHVFWWTQKPHVYWWTQKIIQGPLKDTRFWVHQKKWGFRKGKKSETRVFWVHQKTWGFKRGRVHQKTWGFWVHQKTWGFMRGNTKMGPSKHMRFLVHQMKFCIKFDCANEFFDGGNFSKRGHWGCRGKAPARISKHCLVLGVG